MKAKRREAKDVGSILTRSPRRGPVAEIGFQARALHGDALVSPWSTQHPPPCREWAGRPAMPSCIRKTFRLLPAR